MNQMVKDKNNKNTSSNSLVFGRWPQTKIRFFVLIFLEKGTCSKIDFGLNVKKQTGQYTK